MRAMFKASGIQEERRMGDAPVCGTRRPVFWKLMECASAKLVSCTNSKNLPNSCLRIGDEVTVAYEPECEKTNIRLFGNSLFAEQTTTKGFRLAGEAPRFREHLTNRHCAVRVVGFAAPIKRDPTAFIAESDALTYQSGGTAAGWTATESMTALMKALGTDQAAIPRSPLVPTVSSLMGTVEAVLNVVAINPELERALDAAEFSLEIMQIPDPIGLTAVFRMSHGGADIQWIYRKRREYQAPDPKTLYKGAVIKSTRIGAEVFVAYGKLWRDSMRHLTQAAA